MAMQREPVPDPEYGPIRPPIANFQADVPRFRPRPAVSPPRAIPRQEPQVQDAFTVGSTRGPEAAPSTRQRIHDAERVRQTEAKLTAVQGALAKAEKVAHQAQQDMRASERARDAAELRAQQAEAKLAEITARLKADEHLMKLGVAERERAEAAQAALATARTWRTSLERQRARIEKLVDRTRRLPQVRNNPDLIEELSALKGEDLREHVKVLAVVLEEALGRAAMAEAVPLQDLSDADPELLRRSLRSLERIVDRYAAQSDQKVAVAPAADGKIDGEVGPDPVSMVDVRDSVGVVRGDNSDVNVIHLCEVDQPVVEIAELMEMGPDGPVFGWSSSAFEPGRVTGSTTSVTSNALSVGFWTNIWKCDGTAVGDNITMQITRHHKVEGCRVNLRELLRDDEVRNALAMSRGDSPEAEAARERLPDTVARAVDSADLSSLVPVADIAERASAGQRPRVRQRGPRLVVTHGVGVGVGANPAVSVATRTQVGQIHVE